MLGVRVWSPRTFYSLAGPESSLDPRYRTGRDIARQGSTEAIESDVLKRYWEATMLLIALCALITGIVALSVFRP